MSPAPDHARPKRPGRRGRWLDVLSWSVLAALLLLLAAAYWYRVWPVQNLRARLNSYLAPPPHEPIDDRDNMARMREAVRTIRERRLYHGADVLLDVWLQYDATDNDVGSAARETLVSFGERALPAIEARLKEEKTRKYGWAGGLEALRAEILGAPAPSP